MSDLIERLRDEYNEVSLLDSRLEAADRIAELEAELAVWKTWGIVEIAARNPRVMEYVGHWEGRCLKAEAANDKMRKCLEAIAEHHKDCLMLDHGALNKLMQLYHTERRDFAREGLKDAAPIPPTVTPSQQISIPIIRYKELIDCLEAMASGKGGWAWEDVLQEHQVMLDDFILARPDEVTK